METRVEKSNSFEPEIFFLKDFNHEPIRRINEHVIRQTKRANSFCVKLSHSHFDHFQQRFEGIKGDDFSFPNDDVESQLQFVISWSLKKIKVLPLNKTSTDITKLYHMRDVYLWTRRFLGLFDLHLLELHCLTRKRRKHFYKLTVFQNKPEEVKTAD